MKLKQPEIRGFSYTDKQKESSKVTPMMAQYLEVKSRHKEYLLFYRMGDFYELFFEDAKVAASSLGIALTKRGKINNIDIPMCGVPVHSAQTYLARLIKGGFKVAIAEQFENSDQDLKKNNKIFKRDVVKIITPGTILDDNLLDSKTYNHLLSVGVSKGEISLAWVDMTSGSIKFQTIKSVSDVKENLMECINKIEPGEIMVSCKTLESGFYKDLLKKYQNITTEVKESFYNIENVNQKIDEFFDKNSTKNNKDLSTNELSTVGSLICYLELTQKNNIPCLKNLQKIERNDFMQVDLFSERSLEIFVKTDGEKSGSLLDILDETKTSIGARLLREFMKHPRVDKKTISFRHDCIESLINDDEVLRKIRDNLEGIPDAERAFSRISAYTNNPRDLILLNIFLIRSEQIFKTLKVSKSKTLNMLIIDKNNQQILNNIKKTIQSQINENPPINLSEGGVIKNGVSKKLDELRDIKEIKRNKILELQSKYVIATGINNLKIKFNNIHGYFIEVTNKNAEKVTLNQNYNFKLLQNTVNNSRFYTDKLKEISREIENAEYESIEIEKKLYRKICDSINSDNFGLSMAMEKISFIDVISNFSAISKERNYIRPKIFNDTLIKIKNGRHPVVEESLKKKGEYFTPNNCKLDKKESTWLMTGPNMAGKSTFLRQIAITVFLNQIGCYVPAESANLSIFDKIFTRIGASDNLAQGMSTFMTEMVETAKIINEASEKSLVILDELGRGTSTEDGFAIAHSVLEFIVNKLRCITLFATHYKDLCTLSELYQQIKLKTMQIKKWNEEIIFLYKVIDGISEGSFGIHVANLAGIENSIVFRAKEIIQKTKKKENKLELEKPNFKSPDTRNLKHEKVIKIISELDLDNLSAKDSLDILYTLRKNFFN